MELLVKSKLENSSNLGRLASCLLLLLLVGCANNSSAKFKEAGCAAADVAWRDFDEAAIQFRLAAENGDPDAVKAYIASEEIEKIESEETYVWSDFDAILARKKSLASDVSDYCGSEYDIGRIW
jgi:hypothetical protein